ncbi:ribosomal-protein-alanine N-acetyltransferase [Barrientosiimonas humi]|uniref:Ribosomal-protein-alanine N-acetyltransferase n=1 Tax=Barrientosiimonas humi TaxID=999931 RepID=A0A542XEQ8_9MICO|nr:ribosomal-protein-alanine N-acetyltransferase [Barrientosiimonas humi]CAG7574303.1 Putative ribosomal N-acetyltransferase YdaF [Barrientosiimonas humi]
MLLAGAVGGRAVRLRRLRPYADREEWLRLRRDNAAWTGPWDSTSPTPGSRPVSFARMVRDQEREARAERLLPFAVEVDGRLAGQMHLFGITRGALQSAAAGYWIARPLAGHGITPYALALLLDHALGPMQLHRVEVNIRPDNAASLRVVSKLGMRDEGTRRGYLHIAGAWHDHRSFALTVEDLAGERVVDRLKRLSQAPL